MTTSVPGSSASDSMPVDHPRLYGRVAVVTGAAGGIGVAITRRMVAEGARVLAADRDQGRLSELADSVPVDAIEPLCSDLADRGSRDKIIPAAIDRFGRVDILVNNAADNGPRLSFLDYDWDAWGRVVETNLTASAVLSQQAARDMTVRHSGVIVNITSIRDRLPIPTYSAYEASKGGVSALTRTCAVELAEYGIRVNAVAPGVIDTPTVVPARRPGSAALLGRDGSPDEFANAVAFLASDDASFITGTVLTVDGGRTISRIPDPLAEAVIALAREQSPERTR